MKPPFQIDRILKVIGIEDGDNPKSTPVSKPLLSCDGPECKNVWNYLQLIGHAQLLNRFHSTGNVNDSSSVCSLTQESRDTDCQISTWRARSRYAVSSSNLKPDMTKGIECFVDADLAGGWDQIDSGNPDIVLSRTGFVMQSEIALSTTESEYSDESSNEGCHTIDDSSSRNRCHTRPTYSQTFDSLQGFHSNRCIAVAESTKFTPRTHISIKYQHFRSFVKRNIIRILPNRYQRTYCRYLTKLLDESLFVYLRKKFINGWW